MCSRCLCVKEIKTLQKLYGILGKVLAITSYIYLFIEDPKEIQFVMRAVATLLPVTVN